MPDLSNIELVALIVPLIHLIGAVNAIHALNYTRTPQGSIAWSICLVTFPYLAIPLYWVFGSHKHREYLRARRAIQLPSKKLIADFKVHRADLNTPELQPHLKFHEVTEKLADFPFTIANRAKLLSGGEETFTDMFDAISAAKQYVLLEYFIVRDDKLGRRLKDLLIKKAAQGVKIYFIFDGVGSFELSNAYIEELRAAGVEIHSFRSSLKRMKKFSINFRNHRKITLIDGEIAYIGGRNIADEYLGWHPKLGKWRDLQIRIEGPAVLGIQRIFVEDYFWVQRGIPPLNWTALPGDGESLIAPVATGPIGDIDACTLLFVAAANTAQKRLWIETPYLVPDEILSNAFALAALRGVDVRILIPSKSDHFLSYLAAYSYIADYLAAKIRLFRYKDGFLHSKALLVDNAISFIGTANLDNRSIRLNFELTAVISDPEFAAKTAEMFEADFAKSYEVTTDEFKELGFFHRIAVRLARLWAPVL